MSMVLKGVTQLGLPVTTKERLVRHAKVGKAVQLKTVKQTAWPFRTVIFSLAMNEEVAFCTTVATIRVAQVSQDGPCNGQGLSNYLIVSECSNFYSKHSIFFLIELVSLLGA